MIGRIFISLCLVVSVTGCSQISLPLFKRKPAEPVAPQVTVETPGEDQIRPAMRPGTTTPSGQIIEARTPEEFDTTTEEERVVASQTQGGSEQVLGVTVASLGDVTEQGFWMKTPLVDKISRGSVYSATTGKTVGVDLIPLEGPQTGGSRLSLAAFRILDENLTGLPELQVSLIN